MRTMLAGLRRIRQIGRAGALDGWRGAEVVPGEAIDDDRALRQFVYSTYGTYFHLVGTCAVGDTEMSVVDPELRVHGIDGLRVADASVMPSIPSANTNATVCAIAERAAELDVLRLREVLVAEEDDLPLQKGGADLGNELGREVGEVDAQDLGAGVPRHRAHVDAECGGRRRRGGHGSP